MLTNGDRFVSDFSRGMNMGNMLEAPHEGEWGVRVKDEYFKLIKEKGFDFVRIPTKWSNYTTGKYDIISSEFFARVDHVVDEALKNGLHVVLNMHHFNEINKEPELYENKLYNIWGQLGEHYKNLPENVIFEINNEPNTKLTTPVWNPFQKKCIEIIRKTNPNRSVMVSGGEWGGPSGLPLLDLPDDKNLVASFHFYDPFQFTHQGASWSAGTEKFLGTRWTASDKEKDDMKRVFDKVADFRTKSGLPVFLGEFGAYSKADMDSRVCWTAYVSSLAEEYGYAWCYWEFASGFGIYDPNKNTFRDGLTNALVGRPRK